MLKNNNVMYLFIFCLFFDFISDRECNTSHQVNQSRDLEVVQGIKVMLLEQKWQAILDFRTPRCLRIFLDVSTDPVSI